MERFLLDSNIVIGILNGAIDPPVIGGDICISVITVMEVYALAGMSPDEERRIDDALRALRVLPLTVAVARRAGLLARTRRRGAPDLLIAATALTYGFTLITKNLRDYRGIPGLRVRQP